MDSVRLEEGHVRIGFTDEASLRDGLARLAFLTGWDATTEHHVAGWGRPDLFLTGPGNYGDHKVAVEIKLELTKRAQIRRAFQQADAYAKALPLVNIVLTAPEIDQDIAREYKRAFPDIYLFTADDFCDYLYAAEIGLTARHKIALERHREFARQLDISTGVLSKLHAVYGSPVGFLPESPEIRFNPPAEECDPPSRTTVPRKRASRSRKKVTQEVS